MYGDLGHKLVGEAKRVANLSEISLYLNDLVNSIVRETKELQNDAEFLAEMDVLEIEGIDEKKLQLQLFLVQLSMRRNKRCLLAYEKLRANKIVQFSWLNIDPLDMELAGPEDNLTENSTSTIPKSSTSGGGFGNMYSVNSTPGLADYTTKLSINNLSHAEQEYFRQYQNLLLNYKSNFGDIDLSGDLLPPQDIFIDVRVLKDGGEVTTEFGVFNIVKDSQFYVRKLDVERLIQQGYLEKI